MHIAILTFQGFNELDSLIALGVLNRIRKPTWRVTLCCPETTVTSMNGVVVHAQSTLAEAKSADAVIVGSGIRTSETVVEEASPGSSRGQRARKRPDRRCTMWRRSGRKTSTLPER